MKVTNLAGCLLQNISAFEQVSANDSAVTSRWAVADAAFAKLELHAYILGCIFKKLMENKQCQAAMSTW